MRLAIFLPSFNQGGVERMLVNMSRGLDRLGVAVDLITCRADAPYLGQIDGSIRLLTPKPTHDDLTGWLAAYIDNERPDAVLSSKRHDCEIILRARQRCRHPFSLINRPGTAVSQRLQGMNALRRWRTRRRLRRMYGQADAIVANSEGVAADIREVTGVAPARIHVIRNPVVTPELSALAAETLQHPWLTGDGPPVVLGVGRLGRVKGFHTLIHAFAMLRRQRSVRLVLLGEGPLRRDLLRLAEQLNVGKDVDLPGFVENPYPYMARAAAFVLSSEREGSPNALTEALACGTPAVSTDCRSGPREILADGRYGRLVPVGDQAALAEAITATLDAPLPREVLQEAVIEYTMEENARRYLAVLDSLVSAKSHGASR